MEELYMWESWLHNKTFHYNTSHVPTLAFLNWCTWWHSPGSSTPHNSREWHACDICGKSICVRAEGNKNFLQHCGLPGCLRATKKATTASSARQAEQNTVKITSFFSKEAVKVPKLTGSTTSLAACAPLSPPLSPVSPLIHQTDLVIKQHCQQPINTLCVLTCMQLHS